MLGNKGQNHTKVCLHPCKLFSWFSIWLVWASPAAFLSGRWCHGEGKLVFSGKVANLKRSKSWLRRGSPGQQAGGCAMGAWADPSYSLPQLGGNLIPWVLRCQRVAREERRGEDFRHLTSCWEDGYALHRARGCASPASSKQMHLHHLSKGCRR